MSTSATPRCRCGHRGQPEGRRRGVGRACLHRRSTGSTAWRGRNGHGGKLAVADWQDIALNGRRVALAFDSDVTRKREVHQALLELAGYLASKGATSSTCTCPTAATPRPAWTTTSPRMAPDGLLGTASARSRPPSCQTASTPRMMSPSTPSAVRAHLHTPPALASDQDILARLVVT